MHYVVDVLPQVVVVLNVPDEATLCILVEDQSLEVAYITLVKHIIVIATLLISQLGESVYDNTENDVQTNDVDDDLEGHIMHQLEQVLFHFIKVVDWHGHITDTSSVSHSLVQHCHEALEHREAVVFTYNV